MTGLTPQGLVVARLPEIKTGIEANIKATNPDADLRAESVFGQQVGVYAENAALLFALIEEVYASQYPDTATGISLDHVCSLVGVVRRPAAPSLVTAIAYGVPGTVLIAGREAANRVTGAVYRSNKDVTISLDAAREVTIALIGTADGAYTVTVDAVDYTFTASSNTAAQIITGLFDALASSGYGRTIAGETLILTFASPVDVSLTANMQATEAGTELPMTAIVTGAQSLPVGQLTQIVTAISGWTRVNNLVAGTTGTNRETDAELRTRREASVRITGRQTIPAIQSRIAALPGVTDVLVTANNTDATDEFGTLRQHVWAIVEGGDDDEIADVLFSTVAAGIGYRGDEAITIFSAITGKPYVVKFDRPTLIEPVIEVEYLPLSAFPPDGEDRIKAALAGRTFVIGEKLVTSQLYTQVNTVTGVDIVDLTVDNGMSLDVNRIEPDPNEKIVILAANITVSDVTP